MTQNWRLTEVRFCHRTAKEFFDTNQEGRQFLRDYHTFFEDSTFLDPAVNIVRMSLCRLNDQDEVDGYMHERVLMMVAGFLDMEYRDEPHLRPAVALLDYFDEQVQSIYQKLGPKHNDDHWCRHWWTKPIFDRLRCPKPVLSPVKYERHLIPAEYEPNDLVTLCAIICNLWYVQGVLESTKISPSKAKQLACCVASPQEDDHKSWYVWGWYQVDLLKRLMELGADPDIRVLASIWSEVLCFMYNTKFNFPSGGTRRDKRDDECYIAVIDAFLKAGADPEQRFTYDALYHRMEGLFFKVCFEIDFDHLPLLGQNNKAEYCGCVGPSSTGTSVLGTLRAAPRVRFQFTQWSKRHRQWSKPSSRWSHGRCKIWGDEGVCMSNEEVEELYGMLRVALNTPASRDHYPIRPLADWSKATFMDECNLCQKVLTIPLDGFTEVE